MVFFRLYGSVEAFLKKIFRALFITLIAFVCWHMSLFVSCQQFLTVYTQCGVPVVRQVPLGYFGGNKREPLHVEYFTAWVVRF